MDLATSWQRFNVVNQLILKLSEGSHQRSILIVEDDIDLSISLIRILKVFFKECIIATDGEEALTLYTSRLETNPFTLVITDLELPKMGGLRLIRQIRSLNQEQNIIILSAHDEAEYMSEAISLNVQSYLLKPLAMPKLFESLEKVFKLQSKITLNGVTNKKHPTGWGTFEALANRLQTLESAPVTFMRLRLNQLNNIIMLLGELYANEYLVQLTELLESLATGMQADFYHISVDEFCLICDGDHLEDAMNLANTMVSVVRYFNTSEQGIILNSTLSIGVTYGKENILLHSKIALGKVEDRLSGGVGHYTHEDECDDVTMDQSREILKMIFDALNKENIIPFFQPVIECNSGENVIYESLLRIRQEDKIYKPETFLNLAKEMGQMSMITRSMIRNTFKIIHTFNIQQMVSLHLSSYDLKDEGILPYIQFCLERYNIDPSNIAFQLTEGIDALKNKTVFSSIKILQTNGHKIILNNFGSGQCNLALLLLLQPDYVKLHSDIIQKVETDPMYQMIIEKMVEIIHQIGSKAIASQISSETQKKFLKNIHIDYLQGPLFYEPFEVKNTLDQFIESKDHLC